MDLVMTARRSVHFARIEPFPSKISRNVTISPWPRKTPFPSCTAPPFGPRPSFPSWPSPESEARPTFRSPLRITRIRAPAVRPTSTPPCGTSLSTTYRISERERRAFLPVPARISESGSPLPFTRSMFVELERPSSARFPMVIPPWFIYTRTVIPELKARS